MCLRNNNNKKKREYQKITMSKIFSLSFLKPNCSESNTIENDKQTNINFYLCAQNKDNILQENP